MRRPEPLQWRRIAVRLVALPLIALAAGLVGAALLRVPVFGAVLFVAGIALSIALRRFGERGAAIGRTIALPFMAILVVPISLHGASRGALFLLVLAAGAAAMLCATGAWYVGARLGWLQPQQNAARKPRPVARPGTLDIATRMALQMLVALALAFAIGLLAFPRHWPWIVLSAFIVCSGAISRGDAIYKALLRFGGAVAGTLAAAAISRVPIPNPNVDAALVFGVLFIGIWLRPINYAYWAACATLIFALLQGARGQNASALFGERVLCIVIGALCGVAATWFVYPIRTEQLVRRRVADALGAMREVLAGGSPDLDRHAAELSSVAPPVRLHRAVFGAKNADDHPATWLDRAHRLLPKLQTTGFDRAEVGAEMRRLGALIRTKKPEAIDE